MGIMWKWGVLTVGLTGSLGGLIYMNSSKSYLNLSNYRSYMSDIAIKNLKEQKISSYFFDSDEIVPEKFRDGAFDSSIVSTPILEELIEKGLVQKIDWTKLGDSFKSSSESERKKKFLSPVFEQSTWTEYGIPYFMGKFSFYYRGDEIEGLKNKVSWSTLFEIINREERFKFDGTVKLAVIDDPRTINSLGALVENKDINEPVVSFPKMPKAIFSSDSGVVLNMLASKEVNGGFMYNGDALFAYLGGDEEIVIDETDFHQVSMEKELYFIDFFTISSKVTGEKLEKLYQGVKDLLLNDDVGKCEGAVQNFNFVYYTPPLSKLYRQLTQGKGIECFENKQVITKDPPKSDSDSDCIGSGSEAVVSGAESTKSGLSPKAISILKLNCSDGSDDSSKNYLIERKMTPEKMQEVIRSYINYKANSG